MTVSRRVECAMRKRLPSGSVCSISLAPWLAGRPCQLRTCGQRVDVVDVEVHEGDRPLVGGVSDRCRRTSRVPKTSSGRINRQTLLTDDREADPLVPRRRCVRVGDSESGAGADLPIGASSTES